MTIEEDSFYNIVGVEINRTNLVKQMIDYYALKLEAGETKVTDFNEGSEIRNLLEAFAVDLYHLMEEQNELAKIAFIETAEGEWLDKHGASSFIKLPRDTGENSIGFVTFTIAESLVSEVIIPEGTIVVNEETGLEYSTDSEAIISVGETEATVSATCLTEGEDGNCAVNTITLIEDDYLQIKDLSVNNANEFTGGTDYEEDDEYRERLLNYVRQDDFGSIRYYTDLCENVSGVHDVCLVNISNYTKKILVNGLIKPTLDDVLAEVLETVSDFNNIVIGHVFLVDRPNYVTLNLSVNLNVSEELVEFDLKKVIQSVFDGGAPLMGIEFDGLSIGETLRRYTLVSALELFDNVESVSIINNSTGEELIDINVKSNEVLKLGTVNITQNVSP